MIYTFIYILYIYIYGSVSFVLMQEGSSDRSHVFSATRWLTCPVVGLGLLEGRAWPSVRDGLGPVRGFSSKPAGTIGELCASRALTFNEPERPGQNFGPDFSCHFAAEGAQKKLTTLARHRSRPSGSRLPARTGCLAAQPHPP